MTRNSMMSVALLSVLVPVGALANVTVGDAIGSTDAEIREMLAEKGYHVEEIEREGAQFEVEASFAGTEYEILIDGGSGEIQEMMAELDSDDDDDEDEEEDDDSSEDEDDEDDQDDEEDEDEDDGDDEDEDDDEEEDDD